MDIKYGAGELVHVTAWSEWKRCGCQFDYMHVISEWADEGRGPGYFQLYSHRAVETNTDLIHSCVAASCIANLRM